MRNSFVMSVLFAGALAGCASEAGDGGEQTSALGQSIVFGSPTSDPALDAIGGVVFKYAPVQFEDFTCTGTLVAPQVVLTARHCVLDPSLSWHYFPVPSFNNFVVFGDDVTTPSQKVKIKAYLTAPRVAPKSLLNDGGRDVALLYLDQAPRGITPASVGLFDESLLGTQFRIAGFGYTEAGTVGAKVEGLATARAVSGEWYPSLFDGDYHAFDQWYWSDASLAQPSKAEERAWWRGGLYELEDGFELLAGGLPGEAVGCYGDSGGPLFLGSTAEELTVYGVDFAGEGSYASVCGLGGGYVVMNETMLDFVETGIAAAPYFLAME